MKKINKMRKIFLLCLILLSISSGLALKGVGIVYSVSSLDILEEQKTCVSYGVYNPWDEDVNITLTVSGELSSIASESQTVFVPAGTSHTEAKPIKICFTVGDIYPENCLFWKFGCEQKCSVPVKEFSGQVIAMEAPSPQLVGTGSIASVSAAAPLTIRVKCVKKKRNWIPIIALILAVIILITFLIYLSRLKSSRKPTI